MIAEKKMCEIFTKNTKFSFLPVFHKNWLKNSSKRRRNIYEKILIVFFLEIFKIPVYFQSLKENCAKFFTKKIVFFEFFTENVLKTLLKRNN